MTDRSHVMPNADRSDVIREVLIAATDIVPPGSEPYVGWSAVLADRIAAALDAQQAQTTSDITALPAGSLQTMTETTPEQPSDPKQPDQPEADPTAPEPDQPELDPDPNEPDEPEPDDGPETPQG